MNSSTSPSADFARNLGWSKPSSPRPDWAYESSTAFAQRSVIGMLERAETATFSIIFQAVERLQLEGDHYVREAVVVGLLEDLQNLNLHENGTEPEQFRPFFGPKSAGAWDELYRVWHELMYARPQD